MSMVDPEALERRVKREVLDWEVKWMKNNDDRQQELAALIKEDREKQEEVLREREERQRRIEQEQKIVHEEQQLKDKELRKESDMLQKQIEQSIDQYEVEIDQLTESVRMESKVLLQKKEEGKKQHEEKQHMAALKIQATFRGYRVYKEQGRELKAHLEEWKQKKTEARIKAIDESRKKKREERQKKDEAEQRRLDADERIKEEERQERIRKEEERKRKEEEKKLKAEEAKRKKEEEEQNKIEEQQQREEEKRKNKEAELKKKEEEARRKEEEEKKRVQEAREKEEAEKEEREIDERLRQEKIKQEEEGKRLQEIKEAEERAKEEERKRQEGERQKAEEEQKFQGALKKTEEEKLKQLGINSPRSPIPPEGRPKTPRKKVNALRKSAMSPLANGEKSPPSSAGSERTAPSQSEPRSSPLAEPVRTPLLHGTKRTSRSPRFDPSLSLPEMIERRRLEWMEKCRPWSKTERELKIKQPVSNRKPLRRPISAKNMMELPSDHVLQAAGVNSLQQVTTVELHDLPGCTLKTLANCQRLHTLRISNSKVVSTEGIGDCKELVLLDMQHNALETLNLRDLVKLVYLDVSHNSLTAMQGVEGCTSLRYLRAAHNRITRIGTLEGLRSLHTIDVSHNQLITTKGLGAASTLQEVDLSHNHLPSLDDLDSMGLLQVLKAAGNNIIQLPIMANHVLLRQLVLDDNSLCSMRSLSQSWLPLLEQLTMAQNSLTTLDDLSTCILLHDLDISNNQILDMDSMLPGLQTCRNLIQLKTEGNPAFEESDFRSTVFETVPWLQRLDGKNAGSPKEGPSLTDFERMCTEQLAVWEKLTKQYNEVLIGISSLGDLASVHLRYFTTSHNVAVEQRFAHEYGEGGSSSATGAHELIFDFIPNGGDTTQLKNSHTDTSQMKNKFELALQNANEPNSAIINSTKHQPVSTPQAVRNSIRPAPISKGLRDRGEQGNTRNAIRNAAATRIQALWRGYRMRRDIEGHSRLWMAATTIQALWRGYFTRKVLQEMGYYLGTAKKKPLHRAATIIQALWRGYRVRKRIQYALNYARMSFDEEDLDEDLDFTEVDLSAFDFNEADLEKGWTPPETPQLPAHKRRSQNPNASHAVIGRTSSSYHQTAQAKAAFDAAFNVPEQPFPLVNHRPPHPPHQPPHHPRQAWRNFDSPISDAGARPPLPPLSRLSDHTAAGTQRTDTLMTSRTHRSKKEEQITEEWGFKDEKTAELMMRRAKKLKYNSAKKKKLSQLDPKQRLALFRKLEETTNVPHVQAPVKRILPRKEYFQAREEEVAHKAVEKQREHVNHHKRTFEWIHTQVGNYPPPASSRMNQGLTEAGKYSSEGNLPQMDAHVIAGARPSLTGSPISLDIQSLDSVSTAGDLQRRKSSGGDPASRLPPIKVSSAPSAHVQERMSFRNPKAKPTLENIGWGGGKKRSNRR